MGMHSVVLAFMMGIGAVLGAPAGPAKENEARLALSADKIVSTGKSYILANEKQPWAIARASCKNLGADLATFGTVKEQKRIIAWAHSKFPQISYVWLGARPKTKANKNSEWKWLTGEPIPNGPPSHTRPMDLALCSLVSNRLQDLTLLLRPVHINIFAKLTKFDH